MTERRALASFVQLLSPFASATRSAIMPSLRDSATTIALALLVTGCAGGNEPVAESSPESAPAETTSPLHEIVYAAPLGDADEIFSANIDGEEPSQLTSLGTEIAFPVWSPDGRRVLFVSGSSSSDLMILDTESGETSVVLAGNGNPADWGPRGDRILVAKSDAEGRGLFIIDLSSGTEERVATGSSDDAYARWSRNGATVSYESGRDGNPEIYVTHLERGETDRLTENDLLDEWPSLSHDGEFVAWASGTEEEKNLWVMRVDGSEQRQVTRGLLFGDAFPEWSPDGLKILLTVRENDHFVLKLVDLDSGDVTHVGAGSGPSWR